jgi:hypothetical protein
LILLDLLGLALDALSRLFLRLMLDDDPRVGQAPPHPLSQLLRVLDPLLNRHLAQPVLDRARQIQLLPILPRVAVPPCQPTPCRCLEIDGCSDCLVPCHIPLRYISI